MKGSLRQVTFASVLMRTPLVMITSSKAQLFLADCTPHKAAISRIWVGGVAWCSVGVVELTAFPHPCQGGSWDPPLGLLLSLGSSFTGELTPW